MNNPINASDPNGEIAITTAIMIGAAIIGAISAGYTAYKEYQAGMGTGRIIGDSACAGFLGFSIVYTGGMSLYQCYQNYCYLNAMVPATDVSINMSQANTVDLYRAVSLEEYNSSVATQKFAAGPNSYADEKFFATTYEDPVTWGSKMYGTVPFEVIHGTFEAQLVSSAVAQYWERLDGIGPAFLIPIEALNRWVISIN